MNKSILISLSIIMAVAAFAIGGTAAYFTNTESNVGNVFTAGTIDISVTGDNFDWEVPAVIEDMKPCYTNYLNFTIHNDNADSNPVDVWKQITIIKEETGAVTEPECEAEEGTWSDSSCSDNTEKNDISKVIWYDLYVEVYNEEEEKILSETIYTDQDQISIADINSQYIYLGMIPVSGYMKVVQSYHMAPETGNWAQGDIMTFDIEIKAEQLHEGENNNL